MRGLERFLLHYKTKGASERHMRDLRKHLSYFRNYLKEKKIEDVREITEDTLADYTLYLKNYRKKNNMPLALTTIQKRIQAVSSYFNFLY